MQWHHCIFYIRLFVVLFQTLIIKLPYSIVDKIKVHALITHVIIINFFGSTFKKWLHILQVYWVLCSALKYYHLFLSENQWNNRRRVNLELHRRSPIYIQSLFLLSKEMCVTSLTIKKQQKENLIKNKITQSENRFTWPKFCNPQILSYTTTNPHWQAWRKRDREMLQRLHQWNCHV